MSAEKTEKELRKGKYEWPERSVKVTAWFVSRVKLALP